MTQSLFPIVIKAFYWPTIYQRFFPNDRVYDVDHPYSLKRIMKCLCCSKQEASTLSRTTLSELECYKTLFFSRREHLSALHIRNLLVVLANFIISPLIYTLKDISRIISLRPSGLRSNERVVRIAALFVYNEIEQTFRRSISLSEDKITLYV